MNLKTLNVGVLGLPVKARVCGWILKILAPYDFEPELNFMIPFLGTPLYKACEVSQFQMVFQVW